MSTGLQVAEAPGNGEKPAKQVVGTQPSEGSIDAEPENTSHRPCVSHASPFCPDQEQYRQKKVSVCHCHPTHHPGWAVVPEIERGGVGGRGFSTLKWVGGGGGVDVTVHPQITNHLSRELSFLRNHVCQCFDQLFCFF